MSDDQFRLDYIKELQDQLLEINQVAIKLDVGHQELYTNMIKVGWMAAGIPDWDNYLKIRKKLLGEVEK